MALDQNGQYPVGTTAPTAAYPEGAAINETAPDALDGYPWEKENINDKLGFQQAILRAMGISASGVADTALVSEYLQGLVEIASGRAINYDESGIVDAYVLDVQANQQGPRNFFDGQEFKFFPGITSTGACTANPNGLGVTDIKLTDGVTDPEAGALKAGLETTVVYRSTPAAHLELQMGGFSSGSYTTASLATNATDERNVSHGLGTDDVDMGFSLLGSDATVELQVVCHGIMRRPDGHFIRVEYAGIITTPPATLPATGDLKIKVENEDPNAQTITVNWWARRR